MTGVPRIIGIILCVILIIVSLAFLAPAAISLIETRQGKGKRFGLAFADQKTSPASPEEIKQVIKLLDERMRKFGISNAIIEPSKVEGEVIEVFLPPVTDMERAATLLTADVLLELKLSAKGAPMPYPTKEAAETAARGLEGGLDKYEVVLYRPRAEGSTVPTEGWVVLEKSPVITGADVSNAQASRDQYSKTSYQIDFQLKPAAAERFARVTADNIGNNLAIVLNREVISAPIIQSRISDRGQISGGFTQRSAEDLALILNTGSLPRRLYFVNEQFVDTKKWSGGYIKRIAISALALTAVLAFLYMLLRARPKPANVYLPQTYGQSG